MHFLQPRDQLINLEFNHTAHHVRNELDSIEKANWSTMQRKLILGDMRRFGVGSHYIATSLTHFHLPSMHYSFWEQANESAFVFPTVLYKIMENFDRTPDNLRIPVVLPNLRAEDMNDERQHISFIIDILFWKWTSFENLAEVKYIVFFVCTNDDIIDSLGASVPVAASSADCIA